MCLMCQLADLTVIMCIHYQNAFAYIYVAGCDKAIARQTVKNKATLSTGFFVKNATRFGSCLTRSTNFDLAAPYLRQSNIACCSSSMQSMYKLHYFHCLIKQQVSADHQRITSTLIGCNEAAHACTAGSLEPYRTGICPGPPFMQGLLQV